MVRCLDTDKSYRDPEHRKVPGRAQEAAHMAVLRDGDSSAPREPTAWRGRRMAGQPGELQSHKDPESSLRRPSNLGAGDWAWDAGWVSAATSRVRVPFSSDGSSVSQL